MSLDPFRHGRNNSRAPQLLRGPSHKVIARNTIKNSLVILEKMVDRLPDTDLKSAIESIVEVVKVVGKTKQNKDALHELAINLNRLESAIVTPLLSQPHLGISSVQDARVERLSGELFKLAGDWQKLKTSRKLLLPIIDRKDYSLALGDMNRRIGESLDAYLLEGQISGTIVTDNTRHPVPRLGGHHLSKNIQSLQYADASYDSITRNNATVCFEGTRKLVLIDIDEWKSGQGPRVYILNGIAGTGKSTIAQTIAQRADESGHLYASFFFSRDEATRNSSRLFFSTIAFQLAQHSEEFEARIGIALERFPDAPRKTLTEQFRKLIVQPLQDLPLSSTQPVLIVVDALDECEESEGGELLRVLVNGIQQLPTPFKFFITTRPEPQFRPFLSQSTAHEQLILHEIDSETTIIKDDIRRFLRHQLSQGEVEKTLHGCVWQIEPEDLETLVQIADRLFIVASTADRFIKDTIQWDPQHQLKVLLGGITNEGDSNLSPHATLDRIYSQILEAAIPISHSTGNIVQRFQVVVGSIILLQSPLPPQSLASLIGIDTNAIQAALCRLHSVIVHSQEDQSPRVYHPSFPNFITNASRCKQKMFLIDPASHHARLAESCLDLMGRHLKRNACDLPYRDQFLANTDIPEFETKSKRHIPPELAYGCSHWAFHLSKAVDNVEELVFRLNSFAFKHLLFWLEVLSLVGHLDLAYPALLLAHSFAAEHRAPSGLLTMLDDARRFVMASYEIMKTSALHVYYSALPFAPSESLLFQTYQFEAKGSIRLLSGQDRSWNPLLSVVTSHSDSVLVIAFSPDGTRIASGSLDESVGLWDGVTGAHLAMLGGHNNEVSDVMFSSNGTRLISTSSNSTVNVWDSATGAHISALEDHTRRINCVALSPDGARIATGSSDKTVQLCDIVTGVSIALMDGHPEEVLSVVFSASGSWLASTSIDHTVRVWDGVTGAHISTLEGTSIGVYDIAFAVFSQDETLLASEAEHSIIQLWNFSNNTLTTLTEGHYDAVCTLLFSPDGACLASVAVDNTARLWSCITGACIAVLDSSLRSVNLVVFSPDGGRLACGCTDDTMFLWEIVSATQTATLEGHSNEVTSLVFSPDGNLLVSGSCDNTIRIWNGFTGAFSMVLNGHSDEVTTIVFSPDGKRFASGSHDRTIRLWDTIHESCNIKPRGESTCIMSTIFSSEGTRVAFQDAEKTFKIRDTVTGSLILTLKDRSNEVLSTAFSPDGARIASSSRESTIQIWDGRTGAHVATLEGHSDAIPHLAFSPQGTRLASYSEDGSIRLWNWVTEKHIATLNSQSHQATCLVFSYDGSRLASGSGGNTIHLWDGVTGALITTLAAHSEDIQLILFLPNSLASVYHDNAIQLWDDTLKSYYVILGNPVRPVAFSSDCSRFAIGFGGIIQLWDGNTRTVITRMKAGGGSVRCIAFSSDGTRFSSVSDDNTIQFWDGASGARIWAIAGLSGEGSTHMISTDGSILMSGSQNTIRVLGSTTGTQLATLEDDSDSITSAVISPKGTHVAFVTNGKTIRLWNTSTGACIANLKGHLDQITSLEFSVDGAQLLSMSDDHTVRLWYIPTTTLIAVLGGYTPLVTDNLFLPGGIEPALGGYDATQQWCADGKARLAVLSGRFGVSNSQEGPIPCKKSALLSVKGTESFAIFSLQEDFGTELPLCWIPYGLDLAESSSYGTVVAAGFGNGQTLIMDTSPLLPD